MAGCATSPRRSERVPTTWYAGRRYARVRSQTLPSRKLIESYATHIKKVQQRHHLLIERGRNLVSKLFGELEITTDNRNLFEQLGEMLRNPDEHGNDKRHEVYAKVMSLPSRVASVKALTDALKNLIALEREAYKLDANPEGAGATKPLSDAERASRLATILYRAKVSAARAAAPTDVGAMPEASDARD